MFILSAAAASQAQPPSPNSGAGALSRARAAWQKGDFDVAEPLYKDAIDAGGLGPDEIVDAWVHLGAARAVMGQPKPALEAFRHAAAIDPKFVVPSEAGKRAVQMAEVARREKARLGPMVLALSGDLPSTLKTGQGFGVDATLDGPHVPFVAKIGVVARDPLTQKSFADARQASTLVHFDVPGSIALPGASIVVRVDALDGHDNRLASFERRVQVEAVAVIAQRPEPAQGRDKDKGDNDKKKAGGGFWSSPWPYVIGGVVLAAGGGAAWYFTRSTDDVNVGGPRLQTVR